MGNLDSNGNGSVLRSNKLMKAKQKSKKGKMTVKIKGSPGAVKSTLASFTPANASAAGNMESGS